jgi:hypothetical protein
LHIAELAALQADRVILLDHYKTLNSSTAVLTRTEHA